MGKRRTSKQNNNNSTTTGGGSGRNNNKGKKNKKKDDGNTTFDSRLATILLAKGLVTSPEESTCLAEAIISEIEESELSREQALIVSFEDYFSLSREEATVILSSLLNLERRNSSFNDDDDSSSSSSLSSSFHEGGRRKKSTSKDESEELLDDEEEEDDDDDGEFIGEGECELCERYIRLTKHHLIPRSTWPKIQPRLTNAAYALSKNDVHKAGLILGPGLHHMLEPLALAAAASSSDQPQRGGVDKTTIKGLLQITTNICGPCHGAVHRAHENIELANNYSTVELLLQDERIYKFAKWASKQRPGKHAV